MIGDNVKRIRLERGLSVEDLAAVIEYEDRADGLDASTLRLIELNERKVASHELAELAEVMETTTAALLGLAQSSAARLAVSLRESLDVSSGAPSSRDIVHERLLRARAQLPHTIPLTKEMPAPGLAPTTGEQY